MSSSATPSPIYALPPARIPVPGTDSIPSEATPSPQSRTRDASSSHTQTPSSELRAYTPRAALYTPDAPHIATIRLQSLTPPTALAVFLATPTPTRRPGGFTPSRVDSRPRGDEDDSRYGRAARELNDIYASDAQRIYAEEVLAQAGALEEHSDNDSVASGRLSTVAEGLSDREEDIVVDEYVPAPAVSPQADHPTLHRGQSQAPEGSRDGESRFERDGSESDTSSVRSRLSTVAEGLSDEERDIEDYLMREEDVPS